MRHLKKKQVLSVNMHNSLPELLHQGVHQLDKICKILVISDYSPTFQLYLVDRLLKLMVETFCPCINMSVNAAINQLFLVMAKFLLTVVHWKWFVILCPRVKGSVVRLTGFWTRFFLGTLTQLFLDVVAFDVFLKGELLLMLHLLPFKNYPFIIILLSILNSVNYTKNPHQIISPVDVAIKNPQITQLPSYLWGWKS